MMLSRNFSLEEMACHSGTPVPAHLVPSAQLWADTIGQPVRDVWGPVIIVGPYRTPTWNKRVGGAVHSCHMLGQEIDDGPVEVGICGFDVRCLAMAELPAFLEFIDDMHKDGKLPGLGGFGKYPGWAHLDTRHAHDGHLRRWNGTRIGSER